MLTTQEIMEQLESLPLEGRAQVADMLLRTLNPPDPAIDAVWAREAQRRLEEMRSGEVSGIPVDEVRAQARERLAK